MRARDMCPYTLEALGHEFAELHRRLVKSCDGSAYWKDAEYKARDNERIRLYSHWSTVCFRKAGYARRHRGMPPLHQGYGCNCRTCCEHVPAPRDAQEWPVSAADGLASCIDGRQAQVVEPADFSLDFEIKRKT